MFDKEQKLNLEQSPASPLARLARNVDSWVAAFGGGHVGGNVDTVEQSKVTGWAFDHKDPGRPVVIQVHLNGKAVLELPADRYRSDLERTGYGNGRYGFEIPLVCVPGAMRGGRLQIRVAGRERPLAFQDQDSFDLPKFPALGLLACDIVNNCNLRCPFCIVDYSRVRTTETMSDEVFNKLLRLAELVPDGLFLLSCLHEPTLHPKFDRLLAMVPKEQARKFMFTTNLAKPLKDQMFEAWADSGIHHINISLDTLDPDLFAVLRKFGRLKVFQDNLERLVSVFRRHPSPPQLRYITMAFKSNMHEIPGIVRTTGENYLSSEHEIRYTFNMQHIEDDFRRTEYLVKEDWRALSNSLQDLPYKYTISYPPPGQERIDVVFPSANYQIQAWEGNWYGGRVAFPVQLRVRVDGALLVACHEDHWMVNVRDLEDPKEFVLRMLESAWLPTVEEELQRETDRSELATVAF